MGQGQGGVSGLVTPTSSTSYVRSKREELRLTPVPPFPSDTLVTPAQGGSSWVFWRKWRAKNVHAPQRVGVRRGGTPSVGPSGRGNHRPKTGLSAKTEGSRERPKRLLSSLLAPVAEGPLGLQGVGTADVGPVARRRTTTEVIEIATLEAETAKPSVKILGVRGPLGSTGRMNG